MIRLLFVYVMIAAAPSSFAVGACWVLGLRGAMACHALITWRNVNEQVPPHMTNGDKETPHPNPPAHTEAYHRTTPHMHTTTNTPTKQRAQTKQANRTGYHKQTHAVHKNPQTPRPGTFEPRSITHAHKNSGALSTGTSQAHANAGKHSRTHAPHAQP